MTVVYKAPNNLHQAAWDDEKKLLKEVIRALEKISAQLEIIYMEIPNE